MADASNTQEATESGDEASDQAGARPLPRWGLVLVAGVHALVFAWAGSKLPWSDWSSFAIVCYLLAAAHLATAIAAAGKLRALTWIWRGASVLALVVFGWLSWELSASAAYLAGLYGDLGQGIGAALFAVVGLAALLTVPISCWGLAATWERRFNKGAVTALGVLVVSWSFGAWRQAEAARAEPLPVPGGPALNTDPIEDALHSSLAEHIPNWDVLPPIPEPKPAKKGKQGKKAQGERPALVPSLYTREPVACVPEFDGDQAYAVVTYLIPHQGDTRRDPRRAPAEPVSRCVRAPADQLVDAIAEQIREEALRGPVKIDVITGVTMLRSRGFILDMLALRPGLDGICDADRCLMPWQLVAASQFIRNEPLPWIPDFRFGVSALRLQEALGGDIDREIRVWDNQLRQPEIRGDEGLEPPPPGAAEWTRLDGLLRIETASYVVDAAGHFTTLRRLHEVDPRMSQERLDAARDRAEAHIADAQLPSGKFRYTLDPFSGKQRTQSWNLPRQAGTTLVVCERGRDQVRTARVARRSLKFMAEQAESVGELRPLVRRPGRRKAYLGPTALPAIAFLACRERVGPRHDRLIAGMIHFLLAMQREDGSFYPKLDLDSGAPIDGPEPMYAGGQAVFALSLAEKLALEQPELAAAAGLPPAEQLHAAVEDAIAFYTGPYWDGFLRDFFWLEENWHCLAARASLGHHRNDAYERYCLDYMEFKRRLVLDEDSRVAPEFVGGYSLGNILPPVNTPAAGFGEGLGAAIAIKEARGEDTTEDRELMKTVLRFLLRQQWSPRTCFACAPQRTVVGGFSESASAPEIRIDYTQHAWAALGHGGDWVYDELIPVHPGDVVHGLPETPPGVPAPGAK